jgi:NAD(P)H-dependent FMN reductase
LVVAKQVRAAGLEFDLIDLRDDYRSLHNVTEYSEPPAGSQTAQLRERLAQAAGVVLATPVYHGTFSGLLKNALDHLASDAFYQLPVGTLAVGGGPRSALVACEQLRTVIRSLSGWSTPTQVGMTYGDITVNGPTKDLRERVAKMVDELKNFSDMGRRTDTHYQSRIYT